MTRRIAAALLGASLVVGAPMADATEVGGQRESGQVIGATPHPQDPSVCFQGVARRINMITQGVYNGPIFGAIFDVDKATWGGKFKLAITDSATGTEDVDLYLFKDFGPWVPDDPIANSPTILATYQERNTKGEVGKIPAQTTKAIVCLWSGVEVSWDYKASPKKRK
jgi:hypothetical protein